MNLSSMAYKEDGRILITLPPGYETRYEISFYGTTMLLIKTGKPTLLFFNGEWVIPKGARHETSHHKN